MLSLISFSLSFIFSKIPKLKCKSSLCHPSIKPKNTSPFGIIYSISFPPLQASNNGVSLIDNVMPRENGLSDRKVVLNNPLAFRDDYLNKYFQKFSEFIQFFTDVRILAGFPREFSLSCKMCFCVWLRHGKLVSHSVFVVCLFGHGSNSYSRAAHFLLLLSPLLLPWWAGFGPSDDTCP